MKIKIRHYIKKIVNFFLPSIFTEFLKKKIFLHKKKTKIRLDINKNIKSIKNLDNYIFEVHKSKLRYFGGLKFSKDNHPFLKYLSGNKTEMYNFYSDNQPNNILTCHRIQNEKGYFDKNFFLDPEGCLPWLRYNKISETIPEGKLNISDGRQQFGPVSEKKLNFEIERLDNVRESIKNNGFIPEKFEGYPRGYFISKNNEDWVFYIVGGSHRVAALIALNFEYVPVTLQPEYPSIVQETEINNWPKIKENKITKSEAKKIFSSYF